MGDGTNFIQLNGKRYNTLTGEVLPDQEKKSPVALGPTKTPNPMSQTGKTLDGFSRRPSVGVKQAVVSEPKVSISATNSASKTKTHHRQVAQHAAHHIPQRSHTLMRRVVHKPVLPPNDTVHSGNSVLVTESVQAAVIHDSFVAASGAERTERAKLAMKSALISKFNMHDQPVTKKTVPLAVKPAPKHVGSHTISHASTPLPESHTTTLESLNPFTHALEHATAHQHTLLKKPRMHHRAARKLGVSTKVVTIASGVLAAVLLGGFFAYQNMPNLALRLAATRAGFQAQMPGYRPSGFTLADPIQYGPGEITISFKSNSDDRAYRVTQRPSDWNSETLLDNFVATSPKPYQTYQENGRTIYIYNDNNATWVNGGVWYVVAGESSLNSDQLLRIAGSL